MGILLGQKQSVKNKINQGSKIHEEKTFCHCLHTNAKSLENK